MRKKVQIAFLFSPHSVPSNGKVKVCEEDLLPLMVNLLSDNDQGVVANAAGTVMNTAVITRGIVFTNDFIHICSIPLANTVYKNVET